MVSEKEISKMEKELEDFNKKIGKITQSLQEDSSGDDSIESLTKQLKAARLRVQLEEAKWQMKKHINKIKKQQEVENLKADIMEAHMRGDDTERDAKLVELATESPSAERKIKNKLGLKIKSALKIK